MKIKQASSKKPIVAIIVIVVISLIGAGIAFALTANNDATQKQSAKSNVSQKSAEGIDYGSPTADQQQAGEDTKEQAQSDASQGSDNASSSSLSVSITSTYPNLRVIINEVVGSGTCTLTLTGPSTTTQTADIQAGPSSSTCKGFDTSSLASGTWKATIAITSGNSRATVSQDFNVN